MARETRVALVGCGFFAQNHLHGWKDLEAAGARLVAVCDLDPIKAKVAGTTFGVPAYTSLPDMLMAAKPDLVDVTTRMNTHVEICLDLARRGIAAIVQKPLAPTWDECLAIARAARSHGSFLAVHENFRYQTPMLEVKRQLDAGRVGAPSWARLCFRTGYDVYANQPYFYTEDRLAIQDVGIHVIDIARVFLGEVEWVSCETQRRNPKVKAEDTATLMMRHVSGAVSVVEATYESRRSPDPFPHTRVEIEGDRGALLLHSDDELLCSTPDSRSAIAIGNRAGGWMERPWHVVQNSVVETNRAILEAFRAGAKAGTDIEDNLKTCAIVEAAYAAAAEKRAVRPAAFLSDG
jgi:D-apiose dehydrogenase